MHCNASIIPLEGATVLQKTTWGGHLHCGCLGWSWNEREHNTEGIYLTFILNRESHSDQGLFQKEPFVHNLQNTDTVHLRNTNNIKSANRSPINSPRGTRTYCYKEPCKFFHTWAAKQLKTECGLVAYQLNIISINRSPPLANDHAAKDRKTNIWSSTWIKWESENDQLLFYVTSLFCQEMSWLSF